MLRYKMGSYKLVKKRLIISVVRCEQIPTGKMQSQKFSPISQRNANKTKVYFFQFVEVADETTASA